MWAEHAQGAGASPPTSVARPVMSNAALVARSKTTIRRFASCCVRLFGELYTASGDPSYMTRPGSGMYSPLESRAWVA